MVSKINITITVTLSKLDRR